MPLPFIPSGSRRSRCFHDRLNRGQAHGSEGFRGHAGGRAGSACGRDEAGGGRGGANRCRQLATAAPVDAQRGQDIKQAIAEGRYPLSPTKIADALIAARYEWMSHDKA